MGYEINDKNLISEIVDKMQETIEKEMKNTIKNLTIRTLKLDQKSQEKNQEMIKELDARALTEEELSRFRFEHPLDADIITLLNSLRPSSGDSIEYTNAKALDTLWEKLIEKSIKCLRYFDIREPFQSNENKTVITYGIDSLKKYHDRYTAFESMLYGESNYYRDHVFHAIRTWLLGIFCLLLPRDNSHMFIQKMRIDGDEHDKFSSEIDFFEKISMWTVIALCHDLGYPLEKSENILNKTKEMMKDFISKPNIWSNFEFGGIQDNINEYIIKFMSTKMKDVDVDSEEENDTREYRGRIQPKYYLKYAKSLEGYKHGIISAVIIYKMLLYFLESDFNLNDDYIYKHEDAKQFYVRREMLRAMASHTCTDIYNIHLSTFSSLLFMCDELQEWGRKSWNELYAGLNNNAIKLIINKFDELEIDVEEEIDMKHIGDYGVILKNITRIFERQYTVYKTIFRDGQYTHFRDFNIEKNITITLPTRGAQKNSLKIKYILHSTEKNYFEVDLSEAPCFNDDFKDSLKKEIAKQMYYSNELVVKP